MRKQSLPGPLPSEESGRGEEAKVDLDLFAIGRTIVTVMYGGREGREGSPASACRPAMPRAAKGRRL